MIWTHERVDRSGAAAFVHLLRHEADPTRSGRPRGGRVDRVPHRTLNRNTPRGLERQILELLSDGDPRTFNRIAVELWDVTADVAFGTAADEALWRLVDSAIEHTLQAPIFFRLRPELVDAGISVETILLTRRDKQLSLDLSG